MRVWRICRKAYAVDPLSGRGGLFTPGRWHFKGKRVVYSAGSLSLAALELLAHTDRDSLPSDLVQLEIDIPDTLEIAKVEISALPKNWKTYPAPTELQRLGDKWLTERLTPVLEVPSAVIPEEVNFLVNPDHPAAGSITVATQSDFEYDSRLS